MSDVPEDKPPLDLTDVDRRQRLVARSGREFEGYAGVERPGSGDPFRFIRDIRGALNADRSLSASDGKKYR